MLGFSIISILGCYHTHVYLMVYTTSFEFYSLASRQFVNLPDNDDGFVATSVDFWTQSCHAACDITSDSFC